MAQLLEELGGKGARRTIVAALEAEMGQYVAYLRHLRDENDHALLVRNASPITNGWFIWASPSRRLPRSRTARLAAAVRPRTRGVAHARSRDTRR